MKERVGWLEAEAAHLKQQTEQEQDLRLVVGRLHEFAQRVEEGLEEADGPTRRNLVWTLIKRVEIDNENVQVVYRVDAPPFVDRPAGGDSQHCSRRFHGGPIAPCRR